MQPQIILIAEDDEILRYVTMRQLATLGFECDMAADGKEAVEKTRDCQYTLIFMDVQMPTMDGLEATKAIRELELGAGQKTSTPIIAMTAYPNKAKCIEAGMNDFIFKPVMLTELELMVKKWI